MHKVAQLLPVVEVRRRLPLYASDWRDGLHRKVLSAALLMFFTSLGPALTFGEYLTTRVGGSYGTVEARCFPMRFLHAYARVCAACAGAGSVSGRASR
jgi:hypothetical protein